MYRTTLMVLALLLSACEPEDQGEADQAPPPARPSRQATWSWTDLGDGIGAYGMSPVHTGGTTLLATTVRVQSGWALMVDGAGDEVDTVFSSTSYGNGGLAALDAGNLIGGVDDEVAVMRDDGTLEVYTVGGQVHLAAEVATGAVDVTEIELQDLTGDGLAEILITEGSYWSAGDLIVLDNQGTEIARFVDKGGEDVVAGQMDTDTAIEIATSSGFVIDWDTRQVQWNNGGIFGPMLDLANSDNDPQDELIVGQSWSTVEAYNVDRQLPAWTIQVFDVGRILTADTDNDGVEELIVGEDQWGGVIGYRLATRHQLWLIDNPEHGVNGLSVADLDGDGTGEVYFAAGFSSTGPDYLYRGDWGTETIVWSSLDLDGPFHGPVLGDLDGDGRNELVVVSDSSESGYGAATILVFDAISKRLEQTQEAMGGLGWGGVGEPSVRDLDADGADEIILPGSSTYDGLLEIWRMNRRGALVLDTSIGGNFNDPPFNAVAITDLQLNGTLEVVVGTSDYLRAYDTAGTLQWTSPMVVGTVDGLKVGNIDADPSPELIAVEANGDVWIFDAETLTLEDRILGQWADVELFDRGAGRSKILYLVDSSGLVEPWAHDGVDYQSLGVMQIPNVTSVSGICQPIPGMLAVGHGQMISMFDPMTLARRWGSDATASGLGANAVYLRATGELVTAGADGVYAFGR